MVQIRASGPARDTQHLADLGVRKALDIMQDDYGARAIGQLGERSLQPLPQLAPFCRITKRRRHGVRQFFRVPDFAATSEIQCRVGDDAIQPGSKCLARIESIQGLMRTQKTFLHRILGIFVRQNDGACYCVRPPLMQPNQSGETTIVTCLGKANELLLFIRNTGAGVGLLGVGMGLRRATVETWLRSRITDPAPVNERQAFS